ncbi:78a414e4-91f1-4f43-80fa-f10b0b4b1d77 [Sclerotinia trifoliorum]|uniref:78a414e4-91f1-4f43-80fa-f10b0b4b1d77 n=1 Tax=Sclerotinia trifoliorum TaxID=28548 RepID=A0A8H2ZNF1_9HELO|nr:78a414e4-91f1-4f43-80fa-f10b0b4b1d77 [Sclerotinia trifoliorum]
MSAYPRFRPDLQDSEAASQEAQSYLYLCVSECENKHPFRYDISLVTGNASNMSSLIQHKLVDICPCVATEECGQIGLGYHQNHLRDSSQGVLTLILLAKVKSQDLLYNVLYKFDPEVHNLGMFSWCSRALNTLIWENRTGRILEFGWEFDMNKLEHVAESFTYNKILQGKILEKLGDDGNLPVFDMMRYAELMRER